MSAVLPEHFVFIPDSPLSCSGTLFELLPADSYATRSFVIIPYTDPQVQNVKPGYFRIVNTSKTTFTFSQVPGKLLNLEARTNRETYVDHVRRLKQEIQNGNIYEINYCIQFVGNDAAIDPSDIFAHLHGISKAPYAMLFRSGDEYVISASPELFLKKEGKVISSKPIKGTIRRGATPAEDAQLRDQLHNNMKERTENVMAVDVARNDLSQFAERGTVTVNKLYNIESFATVHQMVSTVSCISKPGTSFEKMIACTFPMASMTGAPKLRAMTLIGRHENFDRQFYSGAMGLIEENGDFELSVIIRSIFYNARNKTVSLSVGSAITYLSEPEEEYNECLLKAGALLKALNARVGT